MLLSLNQLHIFYSQQARSYALYCLLVTLLLLWSVLVDRYGQKPLFWIAGTALMTTIVYTHYVGALFCAAAIVPLMWMNGNAIPARTMRMRVLVSSLVAAVLFLPWLIP